MLGVRIEKMSVLAAVVNRGSFKSTNREVWKMEGARRRRILVVISRRNLWRRPASCNGDFALVIAQMHAHRDGDAR